MSDQEQVRVAAAAVRSARHAINAATQRRMAAVATAQDLADAAHAAERAERDAARSAAAAGIHLLTAAQLTEPQIAAICQLPPREIRDLQSDDATSQDPRYSPGVTGPKITTS